MKGQVNEEKEEGEGEKTQGKKPKSHKEGINLINLQFMNLKHCTKY